MYVCVCIIKPHQSSMTDAVLNRFHIGKEMCREVVICPSSLLTKIPTAYKELYISHASLKMISRAHYSKRHLPVGFRSPALTLMLTACYQMDKWFKQPLNETDD